MSSKRVSKTEFKAKVLEYFRQIEASGENVIVTDHGKPVLEVHKYHSNHRHPLDVLRGTVVRYENPLRPVAGSMWESIQ